MSKFKKGDFIKNGGSIGIKLGKGFNNLHFTALYVSGFDIGKRNDLCNKVHCTKYNLSDSQRLVFTPDGKEPKTGKFKKGDVLAYVNSSLEHTVVVYLGKGDNPEDFKCMTIKSESKRGLKPLSISNTFLREAYSHISGKLELKEVEKANELPRLWVDVDSTTRAKSNIKYGDARAAFNKLILLRDEWQGGNAHVTNVYGYCIKPNCHVLSFYTEEQAIEFQELFSDLIEQAKPLL